MYEGGKRGLPTHALLLAGALEAALTQNQPTAAAQTTPPDGPWLNKQMKKMELDLRRKRAAEEDCLKKMEKEALVLQAAPLANWPQLPGAIDPADLALQQELLVTKAGYRLKKLGQAHWQLQLDISALEAALALARSWQNL
jgi:hypothetical protein